VRTTAQFRGRIQVTGVVKNVGDKPFLNKGRPGCAGIYLYAVPMGGQPQLVQKIDMVDLAPGATQTITHQRDWDASSPNEGEFPPSFRLAISYDPDIRMDSNPDNDDCNMNNNRIEKSGTEINALFR